MPAKALTFLLLVLSPLIAAARFTISGKVLNAGDQMPIQGATVFLVNASSVTTTDKEGNFTLGESSGHYELVVSVNGYNTSIQTVAVNNNVALKNILVTGKVQDKNIDITRDSDWTKNYEVFKTDFLGKGEFANYCKILNPKVIKLRYDKRSASLIGSSSDFIIIENKALGYRIKYLLTEFQASFLNNLVYYSGPAYFENLQGDSLLQERWKNNRFEVYRGSSMHFLRSLLANQLLANGFAVRPVIIQRSSTYKDEPLGKRYCATLVNSLLEPNEFMKPTTDPTLHGLIFGDALYITYSGKPVKDTIFDRLAPATIIMFNQRYAAFDDNGILTDPSAVTFDGIWGQSHLADMLPVDYEPVK